MLPNKGSLGSAPNSVKTGNMNTNDSGLFFSPLPLLSQLGRCASTPLTDKLTTSQLDFDFFTSCTSKGFSSNSASSPSSVKDPENSPVHKSRCLDNSLIRDVDFSQESQELNLSFKGPQSTIIDQPHCSSHTSTGHLTLDSGIESDISSSLLSSTASTSCCSKQTLQNHHQDRDIFDKRKISKSRASRLLQNRTARFAHEAGSFCGRETLDIVNILCEMGMSHALQKIWQHLSVEDLGRWQYVSTTWRACLLSDRAASVRWKEAKDLFMENMNLSTGASSLPHRRQFVRSSPRKALASVANILTSPLKENNHCQESLQPQITVSPSKYRHRLFIQEASHLRPDEQLQPCPHCTRPSRMNVKQCVAKCTSLSCQFSYCTKCLCSDHKGSPCRTGSRPSRASTIATKKSKSRLRRL